MSTVAPSLSGSLLVATPALGDPHFDRAVVLVLNHDEDGALGVVINRPTPVPVDEVLPDWSAHVTGEAVLFAGGPVGTDSALALAELAAAAGPAGGPDSAPPGFRPLVGRLGLVDLDVPPELLRPRAAGSAGLRRLRGVGAGPARGRGRGRRVFVVAARADDPFSADAQRLWRSVLRRQPGELAWVSTAPEDPSMN